MLRNVVEKRAQGGRNATSGTPVNISLPPPAPAQKIFSGIHEAICNEDEACAHFQIGAGLYAVGRPVQKIGTNQSLPLERGALFNRFFGKPAHGPPHVAGGASGPIGGCRDESQTDNPDLDLRHVLDINNRKTDLI